MTISIKITANASAIASWLANCWTSTPRPRSAEMNSPTTAPTSDSPAAVFRPANITGSEPGTIRRRNVCHLLAPSDRNISRASSSTVRMPVSVFT